MSHRGIYRKGEFLVGAVHSADLAARAETRRSTVTKGQFMTGSPCPADEGRVTKRASDATLRREFPEFEDARKLNMAGFARDLGMSSDTLDAFANARIELAPDDAKARANLVGGFYRLRRRGQCTAALQPAHGAAAGNAAKAAERDEARGLASQLALAPAGGASRLMGCEKTQQTRRQMTMEF